MSPWLLLLACQTAAPRQSAAPAVSPPTSSASTPSTSEPPTHSTTSTTPRVLDTGDTGGATVDTGPPLPPLELLASGPVACMDPSRRDERVFDRSRLGWVPSVWTGLQGSGLVVRDLDADGRMDIVRTRPDGLEWWTLSGGRWVRTARLAHIDAERAAAASAADYDADGDPDLFIARYGLPNLLLRNDAGVFVDVALPLGLERTPYLSVTSAWADLDRDGDLDLLVGNYGEVPNYDGTSADPSRLYLGSAGGQFDDVSHWLPERVHGAYTFMNPLIDLNDDGYPEIISITDFHEVQSSAILVNQSGTGFEVDPASNFQTGFNGMGVGIGDLNGDRIPDFAQSSAFRLSLMLSTPAPENPSGALWLEYAPARGLEPDRALGQAFSWGTELADFDADGDLDVSMAWGYWDDFPALGWLEDPRWAHDSLFESDADGMLVDRGAEWGFDDVEASRGMVVADLDGNGWLDVVKATLNGPTLVLLQRCGDAAWLTVDLTDHTEANLDAIGARVEVVVGERSWLRWVTAGSTGMFGSGPPGVHFGLADAARIDRLEVVWPDQTVSTFTDLAPRQHLQVIRRE